MAIPAALASVGAVHLGVALGEYLVVRVATTRVVRTGDDDARTAFRLRRVRRIGYLVFGGVTVGLALGFHEPALVSTHPTVAHRIERLAGSSPPKSPTSTV